MMRLSETARAALMTTHGVAMLGMGFGLLYIRAAMTNFLFSVFGWALGLLLVAASLLFMAALDWACAAGLGARRIFELRGLLLLSSAAAASGVFLILYQGATIRMLCYMMAVYALLLGAGKLSFARHWRGTGSEQTVMYILAVIALCFSALLVAMAGLDDRDALGAIGAYSVFIGLQMLLSMRYLRRHQAGAAG